MEEPVSKKRKTNNDLIDNITTTTTTTTTNSEPIPIPDEEYTKDDSVDNKPSFNETTSEESIPCCICFEEKFKIQGILSCSHKFCFSCIEKWSKTSNTCPLCKKRFNQITKIDTSRKNRRKRKIHVSNTENRDKPDEFLQIDLLWPFFSSFSIISPFFDCLLRLDEDEVIFNPRRRTPQSTEFVDLTLDEESSETSQGPSSLANESVSLSTSNHSSPQVIDIEEESFLQLPPFLEECPSSPLCPFSPSLSPSGRQSRRQSSNRSRKRYNRRNK